MKIILIAGQAGSGKTYLGEKIVSFAETQGMQAVQTEFSKYLKLYAKEILGYDGTEKNKPRKFLQDIGSFIREDLGDEHFFTRRMLEDFRIYEKFYDLVVISDVRLKTEIEDMKKSKYNNITTIKVINQHSKYNLTNDEKNHITEKELENVNAFDYIIENEGNELLDDFAKKIIKKETNVKVKEEIEYTISNEDNDILENFKRQNKEGEK